MASTCLTVIKDPDNVEEITPAWLHKILKLDTDSSEPGDTDSNGSKGDVRYKFDITTNAGGTTGYVCNIVRVRVSRRDQPCGNGGPYTDYRQIIIKLLHHDKFYRELALREQFDITEINFYQHIVPELTKLVPGLEQYFCGHVYSNVTLDSSQGSQGSRSSVLVLEDMKPLAYRILGFTEEFTVKQVEECVDFLTKLHSASRLMEMEMSKDAHARARLPEIFGRASMVKLDLSGQEFVNSWKTFLLTGFPRFDSFIKSYQPSAALALAGGLGTAEDVRAVHNKGTRPEWTTLKGLDALVKIVDTGKAHAAITHLDLWRNNILVRPESEGSPLVKIIDWQTVLYVDPSYDLATCLLSVLPLQMLTRPIVDGLAEQYYKLYAAELKKANPEVPHGVGRSLEEFMKTFSTSAMSFALVWFMGSYDTNPELPDYHPRFWKVTQLLYLEYGVHEFLMRS